MARQRLLPVLRWAQLCLYLLFLADAMVFSVLQARYLVTLGLSQSHLSLVFSIYGMFQIAGSIAVMLLQTWRRAAQLTSTQQYWVVVTAVIGAMGASLLMLLQPESFPLLLVARSAQGLCGAVYAIYAMVLMARTFPLAWMLQAVAVMTAGITMGDSLGTALGAVLYDRVGISGAYTTQVSAYGVALLALCVLGLWRRRIHGMDVNLKNASEQGLQQATNTAAGHATSTPSDNMPAGTGSQAVRVRQMQPHTTTASAPCSHGTSGWSQLVGDAWGPKGQPYTLCVINTAALSDAPPSGQGSRDQTSGQCQSLNHNSSKAVVAAEQACKALSQPAAVSSLGVWGMLRQWFVVCECTLVFGTLTLRVLVEVLMPLTMYTTPTWVLGLVFLGEATGSVAAPFLLDLALVRWPGISTRLVQLLAVVLLCVAAPLALLARLSVPGATIALFCTGAGRSMTEALVYAHLVTYVGCDDVAALNAVMSALSLFTVLGCTVGPFIAAGPSHGSQQQLMSAVSAVSGAMLAYTISYHWLLRKGIIRSQPRKPAKDGTVEVVCDGASPP